MYLKQVRILNGRVLSGFHCILYDEAILAGRQSLEVAMCKMARRALLSCVRPNSPPCLLDGRTCAAKRLTAPAT